MTLGFLNLAMLMGLAAVVIPPILHLLNRRRHDVVDWGAMQFLQVSAARKRRFMIEELLLMALRMGLIAVLVLGLAAPYVAGPLLAHWTRPPRETVLVLDASASMAATVPGKPTAWEQAREWAESFLDQMAAGDRVALCLATEPPQWLGAELTTDREWIRAQLAQAPPPSGSADAARAVQEAWKLLHDGTASRPGIVLLADRQRHGWTDAGSLLKWRQLARDIQDSRDRYAHDAHVPAVSLALAEFGPPLDPKTTPNLRLAPLQAPRTCVGVGQRLRLTTALHFEHNPRPVVPKRIRLEIDQQPARDLPLPAKLAEGGGPLPLSFEQRFDTAGSRLVSVVVEPADGTDVLPGDNRQDLVIEVVHEVPILLVDGADPASRQATTFFLARAFADPSDRAKVSYVVPRIVRHTDFDAALLRGKQPPRVVILADVPRLNAAQVEALSGFVEEGGGLFIALGPKSDARFYNDELWRQGAGWLPARLERIVETKPGLGATLEVRRFLHPALELFRDEPQTGLGQPAFTRWWKASADAQSQATVGALLSSGDPWLIERRHGKGRVVLSTLPFDGAWDGHLAKTWEFPVLAHELVFTLADVRGGQWNLAPGQPLRVEAAGWGSEVKLPARCTLHGPGGRVQARIAAAWPFVWGAPGPPGTYRIDVEGGASVPLVVHADARESDLTPRGDDDLRNWQEAIPVRVLVDGTTPDDDADAAPSQEVWWLFLAGVIALLCAELYLTRRMALYRGGA